MLAKYPKLQLEVVGYTDYTGSEVTNLRLAQARAESVRTFLYKEVPELQGRLIARGFGPASAPEAGAQKEVRKVQRRVELHVINTEILSQYLN